MHEETPQLPTLTPEQCTIMIERLLFNTTITGDTVHYVQNYLTLGGSANGAHTVHIAGGDSGDVYSSTPFLEQASQYNLELTRLLLNHGAIVTNAAFSNACFTSASEWGDVSILQEMLDAAPSVIDSPKCPLVSAVVGNSLETVKFLVDRGADVNVMSSGETVLEVSLLYDFAITEYLLEKGAKPTCRVATELVGRAYGDGGDAIDVLKMYIFPQIDDDTKGFLFAKELQRCTMSTFDALDEEMDITNVITTEGGKKGRMFLFAASINRLYGKDLVKKIVERCASEHVPIKDVQAVLHKYLRSKDFEMAKFLVGNGADGQVAVKFARRHGILVNSNMEEKDGFCVDTDDYPFADIHAAAAEYECV